MKTRVLHQPLGVIPPFQMIKTNGYGWATIELVNYYDNTATDVKTVMELTGLEITEFDGTGGYGDYDIWSYPGTIQLPVSGIKEGVHYLRLQDTDGNYVLSELFTFVDGLEERRDFVKLTWWNNSDFVIDREYIGETSVTYSHIRYVAPFKWYVYLPSHVAKHGWQYEVDEQEREGVQYKKSITKFKEFSFRFGCTEALVDAISFIPQHDQRMIEYDGHMWDKVYDFMPKPEAGGDLYGVQVLFRTNRTTTKLHNVGLTSTAYEVAAGDCLTVQFACKSILANGSAEYSGHYYTNEFGENIDLVSGDFVIVEISGFLRLKVFTGMGYSTPSFSDYDNLFVEFDNRTVGEPQRVDAYYFMYGAEPIPAPVKLTETYSIPNYTVTGRSYGNSLVQAVVRDSDGNEWVAGTVTDAVFKTTGIVFSLIDSGRIGTAYKLRAASWICPNISESDFEVFEGVDYDIIEDTLIVYGDSETPTPDDE